MQIQIKNEHLTCAINENGAEIILLRNNENIDFLWNGNEKFWSGISPILFPIVGVLKDNTYKVNGEFFNLNRHGFAKDSNFKLIEKEEANCSFLLEYSEDTLKEYPFKFMLKVHYSLIENNLNICYEVQNVDDKDMYFSIGSHPAFKFPLFESENFDDYYLEFSNHETLSNYKVTEGGLIKREPTPFLKNQNKILNIKDIIIKENTLVLKDVGSDYISIKNIKNPYEIKVKIKNHYYLGIWSFSKDAPFICIEPWYGIGDYEDSHGKLTHKDGIIKLNSNEIFACDYSITINKNSLPF